MKQMLKGLVGAIIVAGATVAVASETTTPTVIGKTFFSGRSHQENRPRQLVGEAELDLRCELDCFNGVISAAVGYGQTFRPSRIADYLFFNGTDSMLFVGNGVVNTAKDVNALNFLLSDTFTGTLTAAPRERHAFADINLHLNLYEWLHGLFFEIQLPIVWTQRDLRLTETDGNTSGGFTTGEVGNAAYAAAPYTSIITALNGQAANQALLTGNGGQVPFTVQQLQYARVNGKQKRTGVADLMFVLGYNFLCCDSYHLGLDLRVGAPTGTRPKAIYWFEPIVGSEHQTKIGGGIWGHWQMWANDCDQSLAVWMDGVAYTHLKAKQTRTFDLKANGVGSRYLILKQYNPASGTPTTATNLVRGPNVLSLDCKVSKAITGEFTLMFEYMHRGFVFDIGWNIWGATHEKITDIATIPASTYGVFNGISSNSLTDSSATIKTTAAAPGNAYAGSDAAPVFISNSSLNVASAEHPGTFSNMIFANFSYTWDHCDYNPFLGLGGEVEFGNKDKAFSQWNVWVKGGFAFS